MSAPDTHHYWHPPRRGRLTALAILVVAVGAILALLAAWRLPPFIGTVETTENAYIRGRTTVIAPQVSGYVVAVLVGDYAHVKAGQVLARIDDRIYRARV
ncbi:biotin/lipoyl-binding protein, partial [Nitrospirillum viridazoti]